MAKVKHRGVAFESGDSFIIIPSISCAQAEELASEMDKDVDIPRPAPTASAEEVAAFRAAVRFRRAAHLTVITAAVRRNYDAEAVPSVVDVLSEEDIPQAYMAATGMMAPVVPLSVLGGILNRGGDDARIVADLRAIVSSGRPKVKDPEELAPATPGQK